MKMVEVEFRCVKCDRISIEFHPEDTDFNKLNTDFEHDFDCTERDEEDEDEENDL
ncbi:hypothetical protein ACOMCU_01500 [Lysinibacillus sp. UGB7]|uniref:hypothetical protein n=1 Tax=Lysinibacillus sp. UGB7 TaxID=3411039 RepID=UPI003B77BB8C